MPLINGALLSLVGEDLAEAALDPGRWPDLIARLGTAAGANGGALMSARGTMLPNSDSVADAMAAYHREGWFDQDLRRRAVGKREVVVRDQDIVSEDEMRRHPMYADLLARFDVPWWASVNFKTNHDTYALSLFRSRVQGWFDDDEATLLRSLGSHLQSVVTLSEIIATRATTGLVSSLDHLGVAAFAIDQNGRVRDRNGAADRYLGDRLSIRERLLVASDLRANEALYSYLKGRRRPSGPPSLDVVILPDREAGALSLQIVPVPPSIAGLFSGATFLVTVRELRTPTPPPEPALMRAFGLTPAEARVAAMLAAGYSIETLSDRLSITKDTARSQLRAIFQKTGYRRQSEMTAAFARILI